MDYNQTVLVILKNIAPVGFLLLIISAFIWSTILAVTFFIKATRAEKFLGNEFDPADHKTDRRKPVKK